MAISIIIKWNILEWNRIKYQYMTSDSRHTECQLIIKLDHLIVFSAFIKSYFIQKLKIYKLKFRVLGW